MPREAFETHSVAMTAVWTVTIQCPVEDVARIMGAVTRVTPLSQGPYDSNAYVTGAGTERYRPLEGAAAGAERETRERPGVVEIEFDIERDDGVLSSLVEAVFQVHSYQEPVIRVRDSLVSRSKGLDDRDNPHRWWNSTGDWKAAEHA